jgi:hypothetical protein
VISLSDRAHVTASSRDRGKKLRSRKIREVGEDETGLSDIRIL